MLKMFKPLRIVIPSILLMLFVVIGVKAAERPTGLTIDNTGYSQVQLAGNISGDGWSWNAQSNQLILNGFSGNHIGCAGDLDLVLEDGSSNAVTDCKYTNAINANSIRISGNGSLRAETMIDGNKGVVVDGGTLYCRGIYSWDASSIVSINGGHVTAAGSDYGILAHTISIGGTDSYVSASGTEGAFSQSAIFVNGISTPTYNWNRVICQKGHIINKSTKLIYLEIGGAMYDIINLERDFAGDGWNWNADDQKLTLSGYNGNQITGGGILNINLAGGTTSSATITCRKGLTISGSGTLSISDVREGINITSGDLTISGGNVEIALPSYDHDYYGFYLGKGDINITGGRVTINGGYYAMYTFTGDISISGGTIRAKNGVCLYAGNYTNTSKGKITFSGTDADVLLTGFGGVYVGRSLIANGNIDRYGVCSISYKNGKLVNLYMPRQITINDSVFLATDLTENITGDTWRWNAEGKELTLNGYSGSQIVAKSGKLTITLAKDTTNVAISRDNTPAVGLSGDGTGTLTIQGSGTLIAISSSTSGIGSSSGSLAISNGVVLTNQTDPASPTISNALLFFGEGSEFTLASSARITGNIALPKDLTLVVPGSKQITIEEPGSMKLYGTLINNGTITGKVLDADGSPVRLSSITFAVSEPEFGVGTKPTLNVVLEPNYAFDRRLAWSSDNETVATVANGVVTCKKIGFATITATSASDPSVKASCMIHVVGTQLAVSSISMESAVNVLVGETKALNPAVMPDSASDRTLEWSTNDSSIATVEGGVITGVSKGLATITATAVNGCSAQCAVNVVSVLPDNLFSNLLLSVPEGTGETTPGSYDLDVKKKLQITAERVPYGSSAKITWSSDKTSIATVDQNGLVSGKKTGTILIRATGVGSNGVKVVRSVVIRVISPVTKVELPATMTLLKGRAIGLAARLSPSKPTYRSLKWESSTPSIATIDQSGKVTGVSLGDATITATAHNGLKATCVVSVKQPVESIVLKIPEQSGLLYEKESMQIQTTISPENAQKGVTWKSSNTKVATVDSTGVVKGKKAGKVTVTATAADGSGIVSPVSLKVIRPATKVSISRPASTLYTNPSGKLPGSMQLKAVLSPKGATCKSVTWAVVSGSAASVDGTGKVTAIADGSAVVRATLDNRIFAECSIAVKTLPSAVVIPGTLDLGLNQKMNLSEQLTFGDNNLLVTERIVRWKTSKSKYVTVSSNGTIKGKSVGKSTITVTTLNGLSATCVVTVAKQPSKATTGTEEATETEARSNKLKLRLLGEEFKSSKEEIATIDKGGDVQLHGGGSFRLTSTLAEILCVADDGAEITQLSIKEGGTCQVFATASTEAEIDVKWNSSDEDVISIDGNGILTALRPGKSKLTAVVSDSIILSITVVVGANEEQQEDMLKDEQDSPVDQNVPAESDPLPEPASTSTPAPAIDEEPTPVSTPAPVIEEEPAPSTTPTPVINPATPSTPAENPLLETTSQD
jgi:uncharacterized protein YjdB